MSATKTSTVATTGPKKVSRSSHAGLILRTGGVLKQIRTHGFPNVAAAAVIAATAFKQQLMMSMLHGASALNTAAKKQRKLSNRHLFLVSRNDEQYNRILGKWQVTNSGIIPDGVLAKVAKTKASATKKVAPAAETEAVVAPKAKAAAKAAAGAAKKAAKAEKPAAKSARKAPPTKEVVNKTAAKKAPAAKSVSGKKAPAAKRATKA